jgi:Rap1a immunity proteins
MFRPHAEQPFFHALALGLCIYSSMAKAQVAKDLEPNAFLKFHAWQYLSDEQKPALYLGFINGFFAEPRSEKFSPLAHCIEENITQEQGVQMINKYLHDNPQRWTAPLPMGIVEALIVKDGPCAGKSPWKSDEMKH